MIANYICQNMRTRWRLYRRHYDNWEGATHQQWEAATSVAYIDQVFREYLDYGGLQRGDLQHSSILELGPGDNLGVALRFIAAGAKRVACVDKFYAYRDPARTAQIYTSLRERLTPAERSRFDLAVDLSSQPCRINPEVLTYHYGTGVEGAVDLFADKSFDVILSCAVLMGLPDSDCAFGIMNRLLKPGGRLIHKIDLSDMGMFSAAHHHPLEFLTIAEPVYRLMVSHSGRPNRRLVDYYRAKMESLGYDSEFFVTRVMGEPRGAGPYSTKAQYDSRTLTLINKIRPRLLKCYQQLTDEDLAVAGLLLRADKPNSDKLV
jgi:SAM-dependent methyltransferase